ncbi:hypothetical protein ABPG74_001604 [Tetrahymena malaccensis]
MKIATLFIIAFVALASADTTQPDTTGLNLNLIQCVQKLTLPFSAIDAPAAQLYQDFMTNFQSCQALTWDAQYTCIKSQIKEIPLSKYATAATATNSQNIQNLQNYGTSILNCMTNNI